MLSKWLLFSVFIAFLGGVYIIVQTHEDVHATIYEYYGCQNITTKFDFEKLRLHTDGDCFLTEDEVKEIRFLNSLTEIVGYHIYGFYIALFPPFTLVIFLLSYKIRNNRQYSQWNNSHSNSYSRDTE